MLLSDVYAQLTFVLQRGMGPVTGMGADRCSVSALVVQRVERPTSTKESAKILLS
jgi:hypothetical protein